MVYLKALDQFENGDLQDQIGLQMFKILWFWSLRGNIKMSMSDKKLNPLFYFLTPHPPLKTKVTNIWKVLYCFCKYTNKINNKSNLTM